MDIFIRPDTVLSQINILSTHSFNNATTATAAIIQYLDRRLWKEDFETLTNTKEESLSSTAVCNASAMFAYVSVSMSGVPFKVP